MLADSLCLCVLVEDVLEPIEPDLVVCLVVVADGNGHLKAHLVEIVDIIINNAVLGYCIA